MLRHTDDQIEAVGPAGAARHIASSANFEEVLETGSWLCGTPEDAIEYLKELEERYPGLEQIVFSLTMGATPSLFKEQTTRFAEQVIPAFQKAKVG